MKNNNIKFAPAVAAIVGFLALAVPASAQTYQGNTVVQNAFSPSNPTGNPDQGGYHITLLEKDPTTFQISSIQAYGLASSVTQIKVQFYNGYNGTPPPIAVIANGTGGTSNNPWRSVIGNEGNGDAYAQFDTQNGAQPLDGAFPTGPNGIFSQTDPNAIKLASNPSPVRSVLFTLTDANSNSYTYFDYVNTPETGSLLLLTAALLPIAFFLRRRAGQNTA